MFDVLQKSLKALCADDRGVTLVEYGIAIALAVALGGGALTLLAGEISGALGTAGTSMPN